MGKKGQKNRSRSPQHGKTRLQKAIDKATLTYKRVELNSTTIEAKFPSVEDENDKVKEKIHVWDNGDTKAQLVHFMMRIMLLGNMYEMFQATRSKALAQIIARALKHQRGFIQWAKLVDARTNWGQTTTAGQKSKFDEMVDKFMDKMIGKNAYDKQVEAFNEGLTYIGNKPEDHKIGIEHLYRMLEDIAHLGTEAEKIEGKQATKLVVKALHPDARVIAIRKGIKKLENEDEVMDLLDEVKF